MKRVVVTGAAGHVGGALVRALLARGVRPRVLVREDRRAVDGLGLEEVRGDVLDPAALDAAFDGADVVFHLAAFISLQAEDAPRTQAINVDGVRNVVEACLRARVGRLVHFSSIHAFSPLPRDQAIDETRPLCEGLDVPHYDRSKAAGERVVQEGRRRGLDAVILNPTGVIGPYDFRPSHMGEVFLDLYHRRLPGLVDGAFNWVDVRDVVEGALAAAERGRSGEKYLLSGHLAPVRDIAKLAQEVTGRRAPRMVAPMWVARAGAPLAGAVARAIGRRPLFTSASLHALRHHQLVSHDKATRELGYRPRPLRTTVEDTYAWFREVGLIA